MRPFHFTFERLQLVGLLTLAVIPPLVYGLFAFGRLDLVVSATAETETRKELTSVQAIVRERLSELADSTESYAGWDELQAHVAPLDPAWLRETVLDFQVSQGVADAAIVDGSGPEVGSGDAALVAAVQAQVEALNAQRSETALFAGPGGVYMLAVVPIPAPAGAGATPGRLLAFAKRLDESFVSAAHTTTGWDVAIADARGTVEVASRLDRFQSLGRPAGGTASWTRQASSIAGGSLPLTDSAGRLVGALVVANDLGALGSVPNQLLLLLAAALAPTVVGALALSLLLTIRIRRRVRAIDTGIRAAAAGDFSTRLPEGTGDEFELLATSHNRLAAALDRRDRTLGRLLDAVASLRPDAGVAGTAREGVAAAREIFGVAWCELVPGKGSASAAATGVLPPNAKPPDRAVSAGDGDGRTESSDGAAPGEEVGEVEVWHGDDSWKLRWAGTPAGWSQADEALLALYANQLGAALEDAALYEEADERARALDRINHLQADFLRGVSHNLQSPLTAIVGLSDDLRSRSSLTAGDVERADVIHSEAQRLRRLVRQLLTMSRLEAGTLKVAAEVCALEPILRRAWSAQRSDREFVLRNDAVGALAVGDAEALEQVFWILFDNAIRYAPRGPITATITVRAATHPPAQRARGDDVPTDFELIVRVEDEGPGVPAAERSTIFRRFQRGSTSAGHEGTGLGLDVARGVLQAMDGQIWYEPGMVGAAFVVSVPAEVAPGPD